MTWFHIPKKKIVLNFYTNRSDMFECAPVQKASKFFPDWWKELPSTVSFDNQLAARPTMKSCEGFLELYRTGFVYPLWSDLSLVVGAKGTESYKYQFADEESTINVHPSAQRGAGFSSYDFQHLKLISPWACRCDEDVKFVAIQSSWNFPTSTRPIIPPAVVDFKYQSGIHINMFIQREDIDVEHALHAGQPLVHFLPLDNRGLEIKLNLTSTEEYLRHFKRTPSFKFAGKYRYIKNILSKL